MAAPETPSAIRADQAWSKLTYTLAYRVPGHLHNAYLGWRKIRSLRSVGR